MSRPRHALENGLALPAAVAQGLGASPKRLPSWMLYDEADSELYEQITRLEEYYPTRVEKGIFERYASGMADRIGDGRPVTLVELGAGTALKTVLLLRALAERAATTFVPVDVSPSALDIAEERVRRELPTVTVRGLATSHEQALAQLGESGERSADRRVLLFIGSSIGNHEDEEAITLMRQVRRALGPDGLFILGTDLRKSPSLLVPAYDDALGVTARFNLNALARINRELGGRFRLEQFAHVALWNEACSRMEMHLESRCRQEVLVEALGRTFAFEEGERIHTESSIKYDLDHVDRLLAASGLGRQHTFLDDEGRYAVHVIEPASTAAPMRRDRRGVKSGGPSGDVRRGRAHRVGSGGEAMLETQTQQGREIAKTFEEQAEKTPSSPFIAGALGSIVLSAGLMFAGRREVATFVGQWVPTLLLIGVYNKLVRISHQREPGLASAGVH